MPFVLEISATSKLVSKLVSYLLANLRLICRLCTHSILSKNECQTVLRAMLCVFSSKIKQRVDSVFVISEINKV